MSDSYTSVSDLAGGRAAALDAAARLEQCLHDYKFALMGRLLAPVLESAGSAGASHAWHLQTLRDLVVPGGLAMGAPPEITDRARASAGEPLVTGESVSTLRFRDEVCPRMDPARVRELAPYRIRAAEIALCVEGPAAGAGAIMPLVFGGGIVAAECVRIAVDPARCEVFYLNNVLHYAYRAGTLASLLASAASPLEVLAGLSLALPPLDDQKRAADELLAVTAEIQNVERIYGRLDAAEVDGPPRGRERNS